MKDNGVLSQMRFLHFKSFKKIIVNFPLFTETLRAKKSRRSVSSMEKLCEKLCSKSRDTVKVLVNNAYAQ